jgi:hypothetical protein
MLFGLCWNQWGIVAEVATAVAALIALIVAIPTWIRSRQALKREIVNDLFKEYTTPEMGKAIKGLHDAFRKSTGKDVYDAIKWSDKRKWIDHYEKLYNSKSYMLHQRRRMVSSFYQRIAFSAKGRYVIRTVLEMWGEKDHPFVFNLLMPIETVAMPELLGAERYKEDVPECKYKYPMWRMAKFWRRQPPIRWWKFQTNLARKNWDRIHPKAEIRGKKATR